MSTTDESTSGVQDPRYTALVYFHGMGTPRRHEEISRLTDAFDQFSSKLDAGSVGRLREQKVLFEPSRTEDEEDVAFVQITRVVKRFGRRYRREGLYRIYEGYWSPYVAGETSAFRVLLWLLLRFTNPIRVLLHPWRAHQRLKLATLYRMYKANHDPANDVVFRQLESFYIAYENWAARRRTPAGDFAGFLDDVSSKLSRAPAKRERALELARRWRRRFVIEQIFLLFVIATVAAAASDIFLFILFFIGSTFQILLPSLAPGELFFNTFPKIPLPQMTIPIIAFGLVYLIWTTRYYLSTFWADVMFWTTQEEKDSRFAKRRDILRAATRALTHVLRDDNCQRIVVIGHSLGSAIAYETLLRLGRRLIARRGKTEIPIELSRLDIISHLVTIGSPIDWIHYFFELHDSRFHRYNRIHDVLKGSTDDPPFTVDRAPATQWINIWDDSDAISSELFSPRGRTPNSVAILDVWSPSSHWAGPVKAHSAYYLCTKSIKILFWIALFGRVPSGSDAIAPLTVIENFIFNYIRPGARIVGGCIVWAALICGSIFLFSDVSWRILLIPTVFIILLLMIRGFSSIADYQWPKQFGKILD